MSGWSAKTLGEVATFERGLTYSKTDEVAFSQNGVLRANNIDLATKALDLSDLRYISDTVQVPLAKKVRKGTLLICTASGSRSHLGKVALIDEEYDLAFGGFMGLIVPRSDVDVRFLHYVLTSERYKAKLDSLAGGTNINNLKFKDIADFVVPLPALEEQQRIVAVLDEASAAINTATANAKESLSNARDLFIGAVRAELENASGGWTTLGDSTDIKVGFAFKSTGYSSNVEDIPLIRGDNVVQGQLRWDDVKRWPRSDISTYESYRLEAGDILLAMDRTWVKAGLKYAVLGPDDVPSLLVQRVARLRPKAGVITSEFTGLQIASPAFAEYVLGIQTGLGVPHISGQQIADYRFRVPTLPNQIAITKRLNDVRSASRRLCVIYEDKLKCLQELKQSLLHRAFSGELTRSPLAA